MTTSSPNDSDPPLTTEKKIRWTLWLRIIVFATVLAALAYTVWKSLGEIREQQIRLDTIDWRLGCVALSCYLGTLFLSGSYWYTVLLDFQQRPRYRDALFAFFASQLGKYIPGKAMVVVIRTDLVRGKEVDVVPAAVSVFVETLCWIFVGAAIASLLLSVVIGDRPGMIGVSVGLMLAAGILTWPNVFSRIAKWIVAKKSRGGEVAGDFLGRFGVRTTLRGWLLLGLGWLLNGFSLWWVVQSIPGTEINLHHYGLMLASVSLATVAGFVSLLPGGIGVRELVIIPLLGPVVGPGTAVAAAILIRLVWISAELLGAAIIYGWRFRRHATETAEHRQG